MKEVPRRLTGTERVTASMPEWVRQLEPGTIILSSSGRDARKRWVFLELSNAFRTRNEWGVRLLEQNEDGSTAIVHRGITWLKSDARSVTPDRFSLETEAHFEYARQNSIRVQRVLDRVCGAVEEGLEHRLTREEVPDFSEKQRVNFKSQIRGVLWEYWDKHAEDIPDDDLYETIVLYFRGKVEGITESEEQTPIKRVVTPLSEDGLGEIEGKQVVAISWIVVWIGTLAEDIETGGKHWTELVPSRRFSDFFRRKAIGVKPLEGWVGQISGRGQHFYLYNRKEVESAWEKIKAEIEQIADEQVTNLAAFGRVHGLVGGGMGALEKAGLFCPIQPSGAPSGSAKRKQYRTADLLPCLSAVAGEGSRIQIPSRPDLVLVTPTGYQQLDDCTEHLVPKNPVTIKSLGLEEDHALEPLEETIGLKRAPYQIMRCTPWGSATEEEERAFFLVIRDNRLYIVAGRSVKENIVPAVLYQGEGAEKV